MGFFKGLGKVLNKVKGVALPVLGTALGGPLGGALGGALAGGIGHGKPSIARVGMGALGGAAMGGVADGIGKSVAQQGLGGALKSAGMNALKNPDLLAGGLSMLQGMRQQGQADKLADRALALREQQYADFAPIRRVGLEGMQRTQRPDLSAVFRNSQNPFA